MIPSHFLDANQTISFVPPSFLFSVVGPFYLLMRFAHFEEVYAFMTVVFVMAVIVPIVSITIICDQIQSNRICHHI